MGSEIAESKRLAQEIKDNYDRYVTGELDLKDPLNTTEQLFEKAIAQSDKESTTANSIRLDSHLMRLQTKLAKQNAKYYKPDSLVFNPAEFSSKLSQYFCQSLNQTGSEVSQQMEHSIWMKMGDSVRKILYTVPSFNFIHGTFDPEPIQVIKKKRKLREKEKVGQLTQPQSMRLDESSDNQDPMITEAQRVLGVFIRLIRRAEENLVCYFEFVTDPTSFSRTVENIFIISLLAKEGCIKIVKDERGLPYLAQVSDKERKERNPAAVKQCIVSITKEDWQDIVRTFNFKKPLIPARKQAYS